MKIYKKIIAVLVFALVLVSTFLVFIPSASAAVVNGTAYDWKVYQGKYPIETSTPDWSFSIPCYVTIGCDDWKLSGNGSFGYDDDIMCFYVQIDKYAGANGSWVIKLDYDGYWKYRDGLDDYGNMYTTWHSMKTEPKDIYITFSGLDFNNSNDTSWISSTLSYTPTQTYTFTFTGEGITTFTKQLSQMENFTFPDYTRTGYKLKRWQVAGSSIRYDVGDTIPAYGNETFIAEWERVSPCTLTFTGEGVTTFTEQVDIGEDFTFPDYSRAGYVLERWQMKNSSTWYDVGETISPEADITFEAVWRTRETFLVTFTGVGITTITKEVVEGNEIILPDYTRDGYKLIRWQVVDHLIWYDVGDTLPVYIDMTFIPEWERVSPCTLTFTGEGVTTFTEQVDIGESFTFPDYSRAGYVLERWKVKNSSTWYDVGETISPEADITFEAVWKQEIVTFKDDLFVSEKWEDYELPFELTVELDGTIILPRYPGPTIRDNLIFVGWSDGVDTYKVGSTYNCKEKNNYIFTAVWEENVAIFEGDGFESFELPLEFDGNITMPTLPKGTTREGFTFDGWSDGAYIYKVGMTYNCKEKNNYTFTAVWKEVAGVGSDGTDDNDRNFIVGFFYDTFDLLKEACMPYLTEFEIPFLNITLAKVVEFVFFSLIALVVIILISKVIGVFK